MASVYVRPELRERGQALPIVITMMLVFGITVATVMTLTLSNQRSSARTTDSSKAYNLAETGLNTAFSVLEQAANPSDPSAITATSTSLNGGTSSYRGTLSGTTWTLIGTGSIPNPDPAGGPIVRTVSQQVAVGLAGTAWAWGTFVDNPSGCVTISHNAVINSPMYVSGNLCLGNGATYTASTLYVGGTVSNSGSIGTSGSPISSANIVGGCIGGGGGAHACTAADTVYASTISSTPQSVTKPTVDLANAYATAQPGPMNGCTTGSMPGGFDTDTTMNRSRSQFNLTPAASYDCRYVDGSGTTVGQLTWNATTSTLTANGVIFFDGNIVSSGNATYTGLATIYTSGTVTLPNGSTLCGIAGCTSSWNTASNLILFVAGSSTDTNGVTLAHNTTLQAAVYAVDDVVIADTAHDWGPIVARSVTISNDAGQSIPITTLPPGAPGPGPVHAITGTWRG